MIKITYNCLKRTFGYIAQQCEFHCNPYVASYKPTENIYKELLRYPLKNKLTINY